MFFKSSLLKEIAFVSPLLICECFDQEQISKKKKIKDSQKILNNYTLKLQYIQGV